MSDAKYQISQNEILNELKFNTFLGEHVLILPAFGKYQNLKVHDSTQDPFSRSPSTECLHMPLEHVMYIKSFEWE